MLSLIEQEFLQIIFQYNDGNTKSEVSQVWFKKMAVLARRYRMNTLRSIISDRAIDILAKVGFVSTTIYTTVPFGNISSRKRSASSFSPLFGNTSTNSNMLNAQIVKDAADVLRALMQVDPQDWRTDLFNKFLGRVLHL